MDKEQIKEFTEKDYEKSESLFKKQLDKAKDVLNDEEKINKLLIDAEKKIKKASKIDLNIKLAPGLEKAVEGGVQYLGDTLSYVPVFIDLVYNYVKKKYTEAPVGTVVAIVAALIYFVSPIDLIPDFIPGAGFVDDAGVILFCLHLVKNDLDDFKEWRTENGIEPSSIEEKPSK